MGSKYTTQSSSGYNASPPSDDGATTEANKVKWSTIKTKLTDTLKTFAESINSALVTALDHSARSVTISDTAVASDNERVIEVKTSSVNITLSDAATMAAGYMVTVANKSAGSITVSLATSTDTIDGATNTTQTINPNDVRKYIVNAAANGYLAVGSHYARGAGKSKEIYGLTYSNNGSDATNDIDIAAGGCMDATGVYWMQSAALTKQSDAAWAVGSAAGWLDTGAIGNNDYYIWTIARSDTGVVDSLLSLSSTAPTMPASYDYKRLIGWLKRSGGTIVAFNTYETEGGGIELAWTVPTLDVNLAATLTTARRTDAVKVPLNFSTEANLNVSLLDGTSTAVTICCPDQTDAAPSTTATPLATTFWVGTSGGTIINCKVRTSSAGLIAARATTATVDTYAVATLGFKWARRN